MLWDPVGKEKEAHGDDLGSRGGAGELPRMRNEDGGGRGREAQNQKRSALSAVALSEYTTTTAGGALL